MKPIAIILFCTAFLLACTKDDAEFRSWRTSNDIATQTSQHSAPGLFQAFQVRIENVTSGNTFVTPFAPGIWLVQKKNSAPIFINGQQDFGDGMEALAEDGAPGPLSSSLNNHPKVRSKGVFNTPAGANSPGPILPGDAYEFSIVAKPNDHLNFATMFVQSNDLFVGPSQQGVPLFDKYGHPRDGDITSYLEIWDAGTEVNEEPGVGPNQAPRQSGPNTGPDENGVVQVVNDGYTYPAVKDILQVTVTPID